MKKLRNYVIESALLVKTKPLVLTLSERNASTPQHAEFFFIVDGSGKCTLTTSDVEPPQKK